MTTEQFNALCRKCKLTFDDIDIMTIRDCLDYVDEWIDLHDEEKEPPVREATQSDIELFFG